MISVNWTNSKKHTTPKDNCKLRTQFVSKCNKTDSTFKTMPNELLKNSVLSSKIFLRANGLKNEPKLFLESEYHELMRDQGTAKFSQLRSISRRKNCIGPLLNQGNLTTSVFLQRRKTNFYSEESYLETTWFTYRNWKPLFWQKSKVTILSHFDRRRGTHGTLKPARQTCLPGSVSQLPNDTKNQSSSGAYLFYRNICVV